jgi:uncharacterized Rmd1/YagE family protein
MFFFDYGVVVFWNMTELEEKSIIAEIKYFEIKPNENVECDYIQYDEKNIDEEVNFNVRAYILRDLLSLCVNNHLY